MIQIALVLVASIVADFIFIKFVQKMDTKKFNEKFWLIVTAGIALLSVEHYYFIKFVMSELRYFDFNLPFARNVINDLLLFVLGFTPEFLFLIIYSTTDQLEDLKINRIGC